MPNKISKNKQNVIRKAPEVICVPIYFSKYQRNKERLLKSQIRMIKCIKHAENFENLKETKRSLSKELGRVLAGVVLNIERLQKSFPQIQESKKEIAAVGKNEQIEFFEEKSISKGGVKISAKRSLTLDGELHEIQEKLRQLNS